MNSDRLAREAEFHDKAFAEGVRETTRRFYSVTEAFFAWYEQTLARLAPGARVLEYGCGQGSAAFDLARSGADVIGIDISPVAVEQAAARGEAEGLSERLDFRVMDAENLEFAPDSFDLVCGTGILHHLDLARSYAEIARVLKPGGAAVFTEPMGHNPAINAYRNRTPHLRTIDEHPLRMDDLELARRWFGDVDTTFYTLTSLTAFPLRNSRHFQRVVDVLDGVDRVLFRVAPPLRRYAWMAGMTLRSPRGAAASVVA